MLVKKNEVMQDMEVLEDEAEKTLDLRSVLENLINKVRECRKSCKHTSLLLGEINAELKK